MLNFAEQTGSGAVIIVWSFLASQPISLYETLRGEPGSTVFDSQKM